MSKLRMEEMPPLGDDRLAEFLRFTVAEVDWKAGPVEVLSDTNRLLAHYGLEIVMLDTGGDSFAWKVAQLSTEEAA